MGNPFALLCPTPRSFRGNQRYSAQEKGDRREKKGVEKKEEVIVIYLDLDSQCLQTIHRYDMGRPSANTKLSSANITIRPVRVRGGNMKYRALRLDSGCFAWPSEVIPNQT